MVTFPAGRPDLPATSTTETLSEWHGGTGHSAGTNEILESVQGLSDKVGTGADTPAIGEVLIGTGTGTSGWRVLAGGDLPVGAGIENLLINGDVSVDRSGGPYTSTGGRNNDASQTLDGWYVLSDGNNVVDVDRILTVASLPTGARSAMRALVVTANKKFGFVKFLSRVQSAQILTGVASLRFKAKTGSSAIISNIRVGILTWSGTADAYTIDVVSGTSWNAAGSNPTLATNWTYENTPANLALTSSWQTFDVVNAAIDTASGANVAVFIWSDDTTTTVLDELWLSDINLIPGATAQTIAYRPYELERALAGGGTLTTVEAVLGADVALNNTANFFDGPSVALTTGVWLLVGKVSIQDNAGVAGVGAKLWDGTTVEDTAGHLLGGATYYTTLALAGIVTVTAPATWKISCRDATSTSGLLLAAVPVLSMGNTASHLTATRIG
jgi:hypothetical protein